MNNIKRSKHRPKSYRISLYHALILESLADIYSEAKSILILRLIQDKKDINIEELKNLPFFNKSQLIEMMLDQLKTTNHTEIEIKIQQDERLKVIMELFAINQRIDLNERPTRPFRILPEYQEFIKEYAHKYVDRIGAVIEYAIELYITKMNINEYKFFLLVLKDMISSYK